MHRAIVLGLGALVSLLMACSSDDNKASPAPATDAAAEQTNADTALPKCPDEIDLETLALPCDCYGHEANATTIVDPNCKTQVVCCPTIGNLRCEDHEYCDDAGNCWDAATKPETSVPADAAPKCTDEVSLATQTLPCDCYGTLVTDPAAQLPTCTDADIVCCPALQGLKCGL